MVQGKFSVYLQFVPHASISRWIWDNASVASSEECLELMNRSADVLPQPPSRHWLHPIATIASHTWIQLKDNSRWLTRFQSEDNTAGAGKRRSNAKRTSLARTHFLPVSALEFRKQECHSLHTLERIWNRLGSDVGIQKASNCCMCSHGVHCLLLDLFVERSMN